MGEILEWLNNNQALAWWFVAVSIVTFIATLIAIPIAIVRLPADYFVAAGHTPVVGRDYHPVIQIAWHTGKVILGIVLIVLGCLMLVLPGQGIITILVGIMLLKFPGKYRLQHWIVSRRRVLRSANWLRRRYRRQPLQV